MRMNELDRIKELEDQLATMTLRYNRSDHQLGLMLRKIEELEAISLLNYGEIDELIRKKGEK